MKPLPNPDPIAKDVLPGLSKTPKELPCKLLYDRRGSELFERICEQPEYYVTRTEQAIMQANIEAIANAIGPHCQLIEFGSGNSSKTSFLLDHLDSPRSYVPIDISRKHLLASVERLEAAYPDLDVLPIAGDFHDDLNVPAGPRPAERRVVFFPGSTLGNLDVDEAQDFLNRIARMAGPGGALLIGIDMKKPVEILEPAYDDAAGVTAEFSLNMLAHINRKLGADFDLASFRHEAKWSEARSRIEISLISLKDQVVTIGDEAFVFAAGEHIAIESSHKYTPEEFESLASAFETEGMWNDAKDWFRVLLLRPRKS